MDHRNPYGMGAQPTGRMVNVSAPMQNGLSNPQLQQQQQNGYFMSTEMMFGPIIMNNGMYHSQPTGQPQMQHHNQPTHGFPTQHQAQFHPQQHSVHGHLVPLMSNQGMVTPENDPGLDEFMNALGSGDLGEVSVGMNTQVQQLGVHNQQQLHSQQSMRLGQPNGSNRHNSLQDASLIAPQMNPSAMNRVGNIQTAQMQQLSPNPNNQIHTSNNSIQPVGSRMQMQQPQISPPSSILSGAPDSMGHLNRHPQQPNTSTNMIMGNPSRSIQSSSFNNNHMNNDSFALVESRMMSGGNTALSTGSNSDEDLDIGDDDSTKKERTSSTTSPICFSSSTKETKR